MNSENKFIFELFPNQHTEEYRQTNEHIHDLECPK